MHLRARCGAYNECNNKKLLPLSQENYDIKTPVTCSFIILQLRCSLKKKGKSGEGITVKAHEIVALQKGVAIQRQHV